MAIFHCQMQKITRGKGKSAVAAAAYRSGQIFVNEYDGVFHDYSKRKDVIFSEIILPNNAPFEFQNRADFWNAVEKKEKSKNAVLAREFDIALPVELNKAEQISLIKDYVKSVFVNDGMCADINIHDKNDGNPHAHVMVTCRPLSSEGNIGDGVWGDKEKKNRLKDKDGNFIYDKKTKKYKCGKSVKLTAWDTFEFVPKCRERWAHFANQALEKAGHDERISHKSLEAQGITDRKPQKHLGAKAAAMERRGEATEIGDYNRFVEAEYHERLLKNILELEKTILGRARKLEKSNAPSAADAKPKPKKDPRVELGEIIKEIAKLRRQIEDVSFRQGISYKMGQDLRDIEGWIRNAFQGAGLFRGVLDRRKYEKQYEEKQARKNEYDTETAKVQASNDKIESRIEKLEARKVKLEDETGITAARERAERLERQRQREETKQRQEERERINAERRGKQQHRKKPSLDR